MFIAQTQSRSEFGNRGYDLIYGCPYTKINMDFGNSDVLNVFEGMEYGEILSAQPATLYCEPVELLEADRKLDKRAQTKRFLRH